MQPVPEEEFEGYLADALDTLPPQLVEHFSNVVVMVADDHDGEPGLLGLYEGIALTERYDYSGVLPDRITLFRLPLCRISRDADDLRRQIAVTVVHEFAHHVGIGEDRLHELGWG